MKIDGVSTCAHQQRLEDFWVASSPIADSNIEELIKGDPPEIQGAQAGGALPNEAN